MASDCADACCREKRERDPSRSRLPCLLKGRTRRSAAGSATKGKFRRAYSERRGQIGAKAIAYLGADRGALARLVGRQLRRELRRSGTGKAIVRTGEAAPLSLGERSRYRDQPADVGVIAAAGGLADSPAHVRKLA